jgi:hypothetical protein
MKIMQPVMKDSWQQKGTAWLGASPKNPKTREWPVKPAPCLIIPQRFEMYHQHLTNIVTNFFFTGMHGLPFAIPGGLAGDPHDRPREWLSGAASEQ